MKRSNRIIPLLLAMILLSTALLTACGEEALPTTTAEIQTTQEETKTEEKKDAVSGQLHASDLADLPKASDSMTKEELRQAAMAYFRLQLSFRWLPSQDILDYPSTYISSDDPKTILSKGLYGGIPYQSLGTGNLYRWLEYYNEDTATFDFEKAFKENGGYGEGAAITSIKTDESGAITYKRYRSFMALFNQCSASSFGGWSRVINSSNFGWTNAMNVAQGGFIPVGLYDYGYDYNGKHYGPETIDLFGEETENNPLGYDTTDVIKDWNKKNGEDAMYKCYAQMKPGDCVVSPGHVMMISKVYLITRSDGSVDYSRSFAAVMEQTERWEEGGSFKGRVFRRQGRIDKNYSFSDLQKKGYIPFTFAEFLDENDPQDKLHLDYYYAMQPKLHYLEDRYTAFSFTTEELREMNGVGIDEAKVFTTLEDGKKSVSVAELEDFAVGANYAISDVFFKVTDKDGKELLKNVHRTTQLYHFEVKSSAGLSTWETDADGKSLTLMNGLDALANGENRIEISVQLWNGEKVTVLSAALTK